MRNLLFIPFILGIMIGFNSCNLGNAGNYTTYPPSPAVLVYNEETGKNLVWTQWGIPFYSPLFDFNKNGDCFFIYEFTIDRDNQPSDKYFTATNVIKEDITKSYLKHGNHLDFLENTLLISAATGFTSEFFQGIFFTSAVCKDKAPEFQLIYNPEKLETNGVKDFYLLAQPSSSTPNSSDVLTNYAFEMSSFIQTHGRDTTIFYDGYSQGVKYDYIRANFNILSEIPTTEDPNFKILNDPEKPIEIFIYK